MTEIADALGWPMHDSVTVHMDAPADEVWDLVSDVTRIGSYSPETFEAEWLEGASGPAVGAKFRGHVKRNGKGPIYWTTCVVTACVPGPEFAFGVLTGGKAAQHAGVPDGGGRRGIGRDRVVPAGPDGWRSGCTGPCSAGPGARPTANGMRATLEAIKAEVEGTPS